ncbi:glycosyl transferase family 1 [Leptolyngbya sp. 'hensonii']|uniref:glycosyltransferase family 4 protein n=1 Tax=Leptolyngbya sp. 'hensonii' TaxID=1922337 RepID=UPI0009502BB3|nr:glycosyltransferase family 4 protein [Leptolyngbya sp. 'hensonii']OLP16085.1 glycosyl transferase family 1 [Leptolyngbya sp. 'hensonii']
MTRLLFLAERFPPDIGGLAVSADRITQALCQLGLEVDVLVWSRYLQPGEVRPPDPEAQPWLPQIYRVGLYRNWDMSMPHTVNVLDWLHQTRQYDAVWGHYLFPAGFLAVWFGTLKGLPSTVSVRGNDLDRGLFPPGDFARLQWTLERASLVTSVSQDLAHKIRCLTQRQDVLVIQNAVDMDVFQAIDSPTASHRAALGIAPDEVVLGFSGELRQKKGQAFLLRALAMVQQHRPACLLLIGEVRPSQDGALQAFAAQYPEAAQRIIVTGHLTEPAAVAQHLRLCDLYLQPSLWEGMPNALLEAMACGCAVIASDAGGIPEIIDHGQNGFLLARSQLHHLGEAVLEFLALDAATRDRIRQAAQARIQAEFSPEQERQRLQSVIARLIPSPS